MECKTKKQSAEDLYYRAKLSYEYDSDPYQAVDFSIEALHLFIDAGDYLGYKRALEQHQYLLSLFV
jgi:hypothetical protein